MTKQTPNPSIAMVWFFVVTTIYFYIRSKRIVGKSLLVGVYTTLVVVGELAINIGLTKTMCGSEQISTAIIATVIPWVIIFATLTVLLGIFPGWLRPFSNTFGYLLTYTGVTKTLNKLVKGKNESKSKTISDDMKNVQKTLATIYNDQSLLVNELTTTNFEYLWKEMLTPLFREDVKGRPIETELKKKLLGHITTKEGIAEYIWYILTGGLVTAASYNYIVNTNCTHSLSEMNARTTNYKKAMKEKAERLEKEKTIEYTNDGS